jgi:TonB-linked SusC/RagA family outer membrane protein
MQISLPCGRRYGRLLVFYCLLFTAGHAVAQSKLHGKVTDQTGELLPGVTIVIKDTQTGTTTDANGAYQLTSPSQSGVLVFSFMGNQSKELSYNGSGEYNVQLLPDARNLSELVVVGYGTQKKVNLTGSVSVVNGEQLKSRQVASTSLALQGSVPGLTITQQSGAPGGDAGTIRIRGIGSINAGQNPLILVDNVEMSLDAIDPNNIESISVLKDAAAAAIYGARAANGVILITTKRGASGIAVSYNAYLTKQTPTDLPKRVNALDHMRYWDIAQVNSGLPAAFTSQIEAYQQYGPDNFTRFNTDWKKLVMTGNGLMHNHNLNISGGNDRVKVYASGSFLNQNGLTANTDYQRSDFRFNTDIAVTKKLSASMDLVLNRSDRDYPGQGTPETIIRRALAYPATAPGRFDTGEWGEGWSNVNPAAQAEDGGFSRSITDSRIIKGSLIYKPVEGLELLATFSNNFYTTSARTLVKQYSIYTADAANNTLTFVNAWPSPNSLTDNSSRNSQNLFRAQSTYTRAFGKHNFTVLAGFATEDFNQTTINTYRPNLLSTDRPYLNSGDPQGQSMSGGAASYSMVSAYGRVNYNYAEKYLFEVNGRWDASSRFQKENWWKLFPSVSAGWRVSEEEFWKSSALSSVVNDVKLRGSYGSLGNQNLDGYYPAYATFATGSGNNYYFNNVVNAGYAIARAANPGIKWETSRIGDVGVDVGLWKNKLTLGLDYFQRDIVDMLQTITVPSYVGLSSPYVNVGTMRNRGWELAASFRDQINDFKYQASLSFSDVKNTLIDNNATPYISGARIQQEGYALNSYYGYRALGLFQSADEVASAPFHYANTKAGDIRYADISGADGKPDGKIDNYDRVVLGNSFPRFEYSLNLSAQYKGFDLTAFFQGVGKRDNYLSGSAAQPFYSAAFQGSMFDYQTDYWSPENTGAAYPRLTANSIGNNYVASSYWIKSSAYLRMKNLVVGYTIPKTLTEKVKIKSARLYVSGQNLFTWDKFFPGFDPEQIDTGGEFYPIMRTYSVGVNINF